MLKKYGAKLWLPCIMLVWVSPEDRWLPFEFELICLSFAFA